MKALITGITGQDGSYLAEFLLAQGYEVHGLKRRSSSFNTDRVDHLYEDPHDAAAASSCTTPTSPMAARWPASSTTSARTRSTTSAPRATSRSASKSPNTPPTSSAMGTLRLLEAIRRIGLELPLLPGLFERDVRLHSAAAVGNARSSIRAAPTPAPRSSPTASTVNYRESYGLHASCGILFNHESPRRGETFVTRKITRAVARIKHGLQDKLYLGNLDARRDWGYAPDYVRAMWLMLQQEEPDDYVIGTGEAHSVRDFVELAFAARRPRLARARRSRPALLPPRRGRSPAGRRLQGPPRARLGAVRRIRRARPHDGRRRHARASKRTLNGRTRSPAPRAGYLATGR